jgi:hypothetical protein
MGTRYIIVNITQCLITAKCLETNEIILIPRIPSHTKNLAFEMNRLQFPVKVAFAMTFNRAQGQSLRKCGILLPTSVWTHVSATKWTATGEERQEGEGEEGQQY